MHQKSSIQMHPNLAQNRYQKPVRNKYVKRTRSAEHAPKREHEKKTHKTRQKSPHNELPKKIKERKSQNKDELHTAWLVHEICVALLPEREHPAAERRSVVLEHLGNSLESGRLAYNSGFLVLVCRIDCNTNRVHLSCGENCGGGGGGGGPRLGDDSLVLVVAATGSSLMAGAGEAALTLLAASTATLRSCSWSLSSNLASLSSNAARHLACFPLSSARSLAWSSSSARSGCLWFGRGSIKKIFSLTFNPHNTGADLRHILAESANESRHCSQLRVRENLFIFLFNLNFIRRHRTLSALPVDTRLTSLH